MRSFPALPRQRATRDDAATRSSSKNGRIKGFASEDYRNAAQAHESFEMQLMAFDVLTYT